MNKIFSYALMVATVGTLGMSVAACSDNDDDNNTTSTTTLSEQEQMMKDLTATYVNDVVFPTYRGLAATTDQLFNELVAAKAKFQAGTLTQADIDQACETFKTARSWWETSESFLYGAATDFGIDPHIDTWPLDRVALAKSLSNKNVVRELDDLDNGGIDNARALVGEQQLGFHGIEFILFRNGQNRTIAALQSNEDNEDFSGYNVSGADELIFACAVAGDLRDKTFQLEVAWLGQAAPTAHIERVEECEFPVTVASSDDLYYGANMINATQSGSTYSTWRRVMSTILIAGCDNICAEVAGQKIGQALSGEDPDYIESPYSQRSYFDFLDNIRSVQYALNGTRSTTAVANSVMSYLKKYNATEATTLQAKLDAAIAALENATKGTPFVLDPQSANAKAAQDAINALSEELNTAAAWIAEN
ncbi:MAG: imelysin [Prevotella sp.]|nr:imelysin [Prevotella sp.]